MNYDQFGGNAESIEMSRYIDLDMYHAVERSHPYYEEMLEEIHRRIASFGADTPVLQTWEFGAGTGLATEELLRHKNLMIDVVELDSECCKILDANISPKAEGRVRLFCDNALSFGKDNAYDLAVSVFAHDHIKESQAPELAANIRRSLKLGGHYIVGGEFLPFYDSEETWRAALYRYHCFIVNKALEEENFELAQLEINALKSGLYRIGDFKRHEAAFERDILANGFEIDAKVNLGPLDLTDVGGVFVYDFKAI